MKKLNSIKAYILIAVSVLTIISCEKQDDVIIDTSSSELGVPDISGSINKKKMVFELITLLNDSQFKKDMIASLEKSKTPSIDFTTLLKQHQEFSDKVAYKSLMNTAKGAAQKSKSKNLSRKVEIPEVWLQLPETGKPDYSKLLVTYNPDGKEGELKEIVAYTLNKEIVLLNSREIPDVPVLVIETNGFEALKVEVTNMNRQFQNAGIQSALPEIGSMKAGDPRPNPGLKTTMLTHIRLKNDKEPDWSAGAAEIYAIVSGISPSNDPEVRVIAMPYLNHSKRTYRPDQIMIYWENHKYAAANIQLMEKDDNVSYQSMASKIVSKIASLVPSRFQAIAEIPQLIIDALPQSAFTNNDDYVDTFYTILKNRTYTSHYGASGNAKVRLRPKTIPFN